MTTQSFRLKLARIQVLKLKNDVRFPVAIDVGEFLTLAKSNGRYAFGIDYTLLSSVPISDPTQALIAFYDASTQTYKTQTLASLIAQAVLTPGGSNTQVQYNNSGALAGITGATTDGIKLTLVAPILGTPTSATLTNATGLPVSTGVSGLGTGVAAVLANAPSTNNAVMKNNAGATLQVSPANPTGATTEKMMGLGADTAGSGAHPCVITPVQSTRVHVEFQGYMSNNTASDQITAQVRFGIGAAPANGVAVTGTTVGSLVQGLSSPGNYQVPFRIGGIITGLTVGTTYWFDCSVSNLASGGTATIAGISCTAYEF